MLAFGLVELFAGTKDDEGNPTTLALHAADCLAALVLSVVKVQ